LIATGQNAHGAGILLGFGLVIRLALFPAAALAVELLLYAMASHGLRESLHRFPWKDEESIEMARKGVKAVTLATQQATTRLGWPFNRLQPFDTNKELPWGGAFALSLLVAWYLYAIMAIIPAGDDSLITIRGIFGITVFFAPLARILVYCVGYRPPISLMGRVFTLRWIIPGYDQVFVAPIFSLTATILWCVAGDRMDWPASIVIPVGMFLTLFFTMGMGPSLAEWRLTGKHRLSPGELSGSAYSRI
jgi:hypothetical protein